MLAKSMRLQLCSIVRKWKDFAWAIPASVQVSPSVFSILRSNSCARNCCKAVSPLVVPFVLCGAESPHRSQQILLLQKINAPPLLSLKCLSSLQSLSSDVRKMTFIQVAANQLHLWCTQKSQEICGNLLMYQDRLNFTIAKRILCIYIYCQCPTFVLRMHRSFGYLHQYHPRALWIHRNRSVYLFQLVFSFVVDKTA